MLFSFLLDFFPFRFDSFCFVCSFFATAIAFLVRFFVMLVVVFVGGSFGHLIGHFHFSCFPSSILSTAMSPRVCPPFFPLRVRLCMCVQFNGWYRAPMQTLWDFFDILSSLLASVVFSGPPPSAAEFLVSHSARLFLTLFCFGICN